MKQGCLFFVDVDSPTPPPFLQKGGFDKTFAWKVSQVQNGIFDRDLLTHLVHLGRVLLSTMLLAILGWALLELFPFV